MIHAAASGAVGFAATTLEENRARSAAMPFVA
jgi:hypothetical protein